MRIPEKPPPDEELIKSLGQTSIGTLEEMKPHLAIINSKYLHWDELPMRFKGIELELKLLWAYARLSREFNTRQIKLEGLALRYVQTPEIEKLLHELDMRLGGKFDFEAQLPSVELKKKYLVNSLMEEAIASSQLEGAATTRVVAKQMLRENRRPKNQSEQMILNNYRTMMYIKENTSPNQPLTLELIKEIQKRITENTLEKKEYEGAFRTDNEVKVLTKDEGQLIYEPPDFNRINNLLEQLCNFANSELGGAYIHPIVKAIVLHYVLGFVHPFNDGNGRTARALFYWYLISQRYNALEYVAVSTAIKNAPSKYILAYLYSETDNNDITYFVNFNLRQVDIALTSFEGYLEKKRSENKKIFETIKSNPKLNFRQADVIISMSKNERPMTIKEMRERYNTTYQTARTDLLDLVKLGYLHKHTRGKQFVFLLDKTKCIRAMSTPNGLQVQSKQ